MVRISLTMVTVFTVRKMAFLRSYTNWSCSRRLMDLGPGWPELRLLLRRELRSEDTPSRSSSLISGRLSAASDTLAVALWYFSAAIIYFCIISKINQFSNVDTN